MDHPYTDPGDGRTECQTCGKWVFECIHSCKGVPVTEAAWLRMRERQCKSSNGCQCRLPEGHEGDHECGHGHWMDARPW